MKRRWLFAVLLAFLVGAFWLSRQSAQSFVPSIAGAIERGLGRKVEIRGEARFLPWRLGFSLADVVIYDDPRFGLEPLAIVDDLQASVRLLALLGGRLEFNRLRLVDPSVNLALNENGWNFPALLDQALSSTSGVAPPEVEVTGGRLNVRFGETKSIFYLWDASLTLEPGSRPDQLSIYFDGVPARTDRGVKGFGRLSARGTVDLAGDRKVNLQAALERSAASELLLLFQDRGSSVTGFFSGNATLQGPLDALQIDGRLQLHEFERWGWLFPAGRGPAVEWTGLLNWNAQKLHLNTKPETLPIGVTVDGDHLMGAAQWRSQIAIRDTPAEALQNLAGAFGFALPGGTQLAGRLNGEVIYTTPNGFDGNIDFSGGTLSLAGKEQAEVEPTALRFAGRGALLEPVVIRQGSDVVRLEAGYQWSGGGLSWAFSGPELDLSKAREWGMALPGRVLSGKWRGNLRYEAATGGWRGEGDVTGAELDVEGLAAKAHLDSAHVRLQGAEFNLSRMSGTVDGVAFRGEFQYDPAAAVQSQLSLQLDEVPLSAVPGWISPALERSSNVLSRTLGLASDRAPDWVAGRRLNAQVQIKSLLLDEAVSIGPLSARLAWAGGVLRIASLTGPGRLRGEGEFVLAPGGNIPMSKFSLENLPWHGGLADAIVELDALRTPPRGTVQASARDVTLLEGENWMNVQLRGQFEARPSALRVDFSQIEVRPRPGDEPATRRGTGQSASSGVWEWTLDGGSKNQRISGPVFGGFWK